VDELAKEALMGGEIFKALVLADDMETAMWSIFLGHWEQLWWSITT
jgi:hypothetical protein